MPPDPDPNEPQNTPDPPPQDPPEGDPPQNPADALGQRADNKEWTEDRIFDIAKRGAAEALKETSPPPNFPEGPSASPTYAQVGPTAATSPQDDRAVVRGMDDAQLKRAQRQLLRGDMDVPDADATLDLVEEEIERRRESKIESRLKNETRRTQTATVVAQVYPLDNPTFKTAYDQQLRAIYNDPSYANVPEKEMIAANYVAQQLGILPKNIQPTNPQPGVPNEPTADLEGGHWPTRNAPNQPKGPVVTQAEKDLAARMTGYSGEKLEEYIKKVAAEKAQLPDYANLAGITRIAGVSD